MAKDNNVKVFLALVQAGLWEKEVRLESFDNIDFDGIRRLAEEQSVVGLVTSGLEKLPADKLPLTEKLKFAGLCQLIEQQNLVMNQFIGELVEKMQNAGINTILVKGQGVAQCYERPLWRACGDVDFLLNEIDYEKAKQLLLPLSQSSEKESEYNKHIALSIDTWTVELHGNMRCGLSKKMDGVIDKVQSEICNKGKFRTWMNGNVPVILPAPNEDVILIFTHFLKHFYKGGIGLRQLCDWCRLLWTYKGKIDVALLEKRLMEMGLLPEWKGFAAFAVDIMGMPIDAMPLYDPSLYWNIKANRIKRFVMKYGNFGHNRDMSYMVRYPYLIRKVISMKYRLCDMMNHFFIFPNGSSRFFPSIIMHGLGSAMKGE